MINSISIIVCKVVLDALPSKGDLYPYSVMFPPWVQSVPPEVTNGMSEKENILQT
jgi:hypothetical protein